MLTKRRIFLILKTTKQRKYVVNLLILNLILFNNKNAIFEYFNRYSSKNSKPSQVSDKLYFPNKYSRANTGIRLTKTWELVLKNNLVTDTLNEYFGTTVEVLDLHYWKDNSEILLNTKSFHRINYIIKK